MQTVTMACKNLHPHPHHTHTHTYTYPHPHLHPHSHTRRHSHTLVVLRVVLVFEWCGAGRALLLTFGLFRCCSSLLATDAAPRSRAAWKAELSAGFLRSNVAPADIHGGQTKVSFASKHTCIHAHKITPTHTHTHLGTTGSLQH